MFGMVEILLHMGQASVIRWYYGLNTVGTEFLVENPLPLVSCPEIDALPNVPFEVDYATGFAEDAAVPNNNLFQLY